MLNGIKKKRLAFLGAYVLAACVAVYFFRPVYLVSLLVVLGVPAVINFIWLKRSRLKIFLFSILTTILFAPPVELAARLTNTWDVQSILPRLFGVVPLEDLLAAFLNFFWVLSFYEYFVDKDSGRKISSRFRIIILGYCLLAAIIFTGFFVDRNLVSLNYHSLSVLILFVPGIIIFSLMPAILSKTWLPTVFFALTFFIYEITSLLIGSWWWPGKYLLPLNIFGHVFPLDDMVIWIILSTPVLIGGYEFFVDDGK